MKSFYTCAYTKLFAVLLFWIGFLPARAQAPAWQSSVSINALHSLSTPPDANGNVYVAGSFTGTQSFGGISLTSAGGNDVYVAKWSSLTNNFVWAQRAGGTDYEDVRDIAVHGTGVYITGSFASVPAMFGSTALSNTGYLNTSDMFVAKLTDAGSSASFNWAKQAGNMDQDSGNLLLVNGGSVYVIGGFEGPTIAFGATTLSSVSGQTHSFVTKLTDTGSNASFVWAQRMGFTFYGGITAAVLNGPSIYLAGAASGTITFNNVPATGPPFGDSVGSAGVFVVKLTDAGPTSSYTWVQCGVRQRATSSDVTALAVEGANVYISGQFLITGATGPSITFGSTTLGHPVNSSAYSDMYLAKLTDAGATGSFTWARQFQEYLSASKLRAIKVRGQSIYIAGEFGLTNWTFGASTISSVGGSDVFVAKLMDAGASVIPVWAQRAGGTGDDAAYGLALNGSSILVAGTVMAPASFGSQTLTHPLRNTPFAFTASLTDPTLTATAAALRPESIGLFPNPARGRATIQLPAGTITATLTILDALGRTLRTQTAVPNAKAELDLTGLAPGLYAVRVAVGGSTATQRLVVE